MGSSVRRKKDKKKDFQVISAPEVVHFKELLLMVRTVETQAESGKDQTPSGKFHRYQFQVQRYVVHEQPILIEK
jgi:hypothetical protein